MHWSRVDAVLKQAGDLSGKVIVTCSLPMNANDTALAIAHTSRLIRDVGFEPVHAGPLRVSWYLEPFSLAVAQLAYEGNQDLRSPSESSGSGRLRNSPHAARPSRPLNSNQLKFCLRRSRSRSREPPQWWVHRFAVRPSA